MPSSSDDTHASALLEALRRRIASHGPIPVDEYMRVCATDPRHGYWQRRDTLGSGGDFTTAPEISQVFGELIGLWMVIAWQAMGRPAPLRVVELGPGRGTLLRDALRAASVAPEFRAGATVHLVEISERLQLVQRQTLSDAPAQLTWHAHLSEIPAGAAIIIGNEFLDALPVRQLVACDDGWHERVVELACDGRLRFGVGAGVDIDTAQTPGNDAVLELRAGEGELLDALAARSDPCLALLIDYGPAEPSFGDTLQAVSHHAYADPLNAPGTADLTAHVQFGRLAEQASAKKLSAYGPLTQAEFLGRLGLIERAQRLMSANPRRAGEIEAAVHRLISPSGMGTLFKAMAIASPALPPPVPFG